jgi:hypothetical protein
MKNVELIRRRVVRGQTSEIMRLRSFISMADSTNVEAVAALDGESAQALLETITQIVLDHLGHPTALVGKDSRARRAVSKVLKTPKGE